MADDKRTSSAAHDEISAAVAPMAQVQQGHLDLDRETAQYVGRNARHVDEATSKRLFWTVNKRILACMLGVCFVVLIVTTKSS